MARILLKVSGNTGRPHPRPLFRESCKGAVTSPGQYESGTQRASDYGDLIKGSPQCQPMARRRTRAEGARYASRSFLAGHCWPRPFAAPAIKMGTSMITRPAHAAGAALRLDVSSLSRYQVELLLRLVEAETDALLVEQP
jgi:hypothetical protein